MLASCGHEFEISTRTRTTCSSDPDYLEDLLTGKCCIGECPVCGESVHLYHGFLLDTICERIGIYPDIWRTRILEENPDVDTVVFEKYGTPFVNLEKHLQSLKILTDDGKLDVDKVKEKMVEKGMDPDTFGQPETRL